MDYSIFNSQYIRDLAWVIASPPLLHIDKKCIDQQYCDTELSILYDWLLELDNNPSSLENYLLKSNRRSLGAYFENLIAFWIEQHPQKTLLARNIQLSNESKTIGELDFIFDLNDSVFHWEVAVKFYLGHYNFSELINWYGPNAIDRLDSKVDKVLKKQLPLVKSSEAVSYFKKNNIYSTPTSKLFMKGYLFYPFHIFLKQDFPVIENVYTGHLKGWWLYRGDLVKLKDSSSFWVILEKRNWLSPVHKKDKDGILSSKELQNIDLFKNKDFRPVLLIELISKTDGTLCEKSRGFVVRNSWPLAID